MYYPESEILSRSYTVGNEFKIKKTKVNYVGDYYSTNDGKFFTGKQYSITSQEIVRVSKSIRSNRLVDSYEFHYSQPTTEDYNKGSFIRYVIKRVNSGFETILEVSKEEFDRAKKDPLYTTSQISWKISGDPVEVTKVNQQTLTNVENTIPGIKNYFTNLVQYLV